MAAAIVYLVFSTIFFGVAAILTQREINARKDFKMTPLAGTLNVYLYYKFQKERQEQLSTRFKMFLLAHLNFALCAVVFLFTFFVTT
jgi:hypothetical protein